MRKMLAAAVVLFCALWAGRPAFAHVLDEYLQATTLSLEKGHVAARLRLIPGVEVFGAVFPTIDTDGDGSVSEPEQRAYARRVIRDLSLSIDGRPLQLRLASLTFPKIEEMKEGVGTILIDLDAEISPGGPNRRLVFENHHQGRISAYLVNCYVPHDPDLRIAAQNRNYDQSSYELNYVQSAGCPSPALSVSQAGGLPVRPAAVTARQDSRLTVRLAAGVLLLVMGMAFLWHRRRARAARFFVAQASRLWS